MIGVSTGRAALLLAVGALSACAHKGNVASVTFKYQRQEILLPASFAGSAPMSFMLDCALDPSLIDIGLARREGLLTAPGEFGEAEGGGDGEGQAITPATISGLAIDGETFPPIDAVASDLAGFSEKIGEPLSGILGYSFFKGRVIRVDYRNRRVDIARSRAALPPMLTPPPAEYSAPLKFMSEEDFIPVVDVVIAGMTLRMSVDTGSSLGVQLYETARAALGLDVPDGEASFVTGARGKAAILNTTLEDVSIGPFVVKTVPASLSKRAHDPAERVGNLGNQFLENFVVTFDYVEGAITFARH